MLLLDTRNVADGPRTLCFHLTYNLLIQLSRTQGEVLSWSREGGLAAKYTFAPPKSTTFTSLELLPKGDAFVTCHRDAPAQLRKMESGDLVETLAPHHADCFRVSAVQHLLFVSCNTETEVYDVERRKKVAVLTDGSDFHLHPEGELVACLCSGAMETAFRFLGYDTLVPFRPLLDPMHIITAFAFRPQGDVLITLGHIYKDAFIYGFSFPEFNIMFRIRRTIERPERPQYLPGYTADRVIVLPNGESFLYATHDGMLCEISASDGTVKWETQIHDGPIRSIDFRPDCGLLATLGADERLKLWSIDVPSSVVMPTKGLSERFRATIDKMPLDGTGTDYDWKVIVPALEAENIPVPLRPLIPLAVKWGIRHATTRINRVRNAPPEQIAQLKKAVAEHRALLEEWLSSAEGDSSNPPREVVAFRDMLLAADGQ